MENKEWIWDNGQIKAKDIEEYKSYIEKAKAIRLAKQRKCLKTFLKKPNIINILQRNKINVYFKE